MSRVVILPLSLLALLTGCTSFSNSHVRSDYFETGFRGTQALQGNVAAFDRLGELQREWAARGAHGFVYSITPWDRANRDRAAAMAADVERIVGARDAILAQRESSDVMANALKDLESEYDDMMDTLASGDTPAAEMKLAADQKYIVRRLANSLVLMAQDDMGPAVEAADTFGRDVSRFQHLLDAALNGDEELGVEPPGNPEVEESLSQIEELFSGYIAESSGDVLENVVSRYDAWNALQDIAAIGDSALPGRKAPAKAAAAPVAQPSAAAEAGEGAAEGAADDAAPDQGGAGEGPVDDGADDPASDEAAGDDEPGVDEEPVDGGEDAPPAF